MSTKEKVPDLTFLTEDHPEANGRVAKEGEVCFNVQFVTENLKTISLEMGIRSWKIFHDFVLKMDAATETVTVEK